MTQEEKQLLLKDLSARLFYGVKFQGEDSNVYTLDAANYFALQVQNVVFKPYLRPMSSMTEEEKKDFGGYIHTQPITHQQGYKGYTVSCSHYYTVGEIDWLNAHHFDYRGLIPMGLALVAPDGMYKND